MSKTLKKVLSVMLCAALLFGVTPLNGFVGLELPGLSPLFVVKANAMDSGTCGDNLFWNYDPNTFTLTINGGGSMYGYSANGTETTAPWSPYSQMIQTVIISEGVLDISPYAFFNCSALTNITISSSVMNIGDSAFDGCMNLMAVTYAGTPQQWGSMVMIGNDNFPLINAALQFSAASFGTCGDNAVWLFDANAHLLTIGGSGAMDSYESEPVGGNIVTTAPWQQFSQSIYAVEICDGITSIGSCAFFGCTNLSSVFIPASVLSIGYGAFEFCQSMSFTVHYAGTNAEWDSLINNPDAVAGSLPFMAMIYFGAGFTHYGSCGDYTTWQYEEVTHTLTISGMGEIDDYSAEILGNMAVTTAPWKMYYYSIRHIVIEQSVTEIGCYAFFGCAGLQSVSMDNSVMRIGDWSFTECNSLTDPGIGSGVITIGSAAFCACTGLTTLVIPDNVQSIGNSAFAACSSMTTLTIGTGVTSLADNAFGNCVALTQINYNAPAANDITYFGNVFHEAGRAGTGVTVTFGDSVYSIPACLFCDNYASYEPYIKAVIIGKNVASIGSNAFYHCSAITDVYYDGTQQQWDAINIAAGSDPLTNATLHLNYLTGLSGTCGTDLTWVFDPNTFILTISGTGAMDDYAANGSVTTAPWSPCAAIIKTVVIENNVTSIGAYAFYGCAAMKSVTIGNNIVNMGNWSFSGCTALTEINYNAIRAANLTASNNMFHYAGASGTGITLNIGNAVQHIPNFLFYDSGAAGSSPGWVRITSINFGSSLESIGFLSFCRCAGLTNVVIPNNVTFIDEGAFEDCTGLTSITLPETITNIAKSLFYGCSSLSSITIPEHVTSIGVGAFFFCTSLTDITFPDRVTTIGNYSFRGCSAMTSITIPVSVTQIGFYAFDDCTSLHDVYYKGSQTQWNAIDKKAENDPLLDATLHCLGHEHVYTSTVIKEATCTEDGVKTYTCECGASYTEAIPAKGHTSSGWQMVEDPTPTSTGRMCQYCEECHILLDEMTVPMLSGTHVTGITLSSFEEYLDMGETLTLTAAVTPNTATDKTVLWTSSKPTVATVENGVVTPVAPGITVIIAQTADCGYKDFCVVQVNAVSAQNGLVIDNGIIYGLSVNLNSVEDYLILSDDTMTIETDKDVIGTGTKILIKQGDTVVNEFEAVIFGDVDGDSWYDGTDAYFVYLVASGMVSADVLSDAQRAACDANHDGVIDNADVALLEQAGLLLKAIDQNTAPEELETNSVYLEYCGLIDQLAEIAEPEQPTQAEETPQPTAQTIWSRIQALFAIVLNWLLRIF